MSKRILLVEESSVGEYESQGEQERSLLIIDLDKLDELSLAYIEKNNLMEEWGGSEAEPLNDVAFGFEDLYEHISDEFGEVDIRDFDQELSWLDLSDEKDLEKLSRAIKNNDEESSICDNVDAVFLMNELSYLFSKEEIDSMLLNRTLEFKINSVVEIKFGDGTEVSSKIESSSKILRSNRY